MTIFLTQLGKMALIFALITILLFFTLSVLVHYCPSEIIWGRIFAGLITLSIILFVLFTLFDLINSYASQKQAEDKKHAKGDNKQFCCVWLFRKNWPINSKLKTPKNIKAIPDYPEDKANPSKGFINTHAIDSSTGEKGEPTKNEPNQQVVNQQKESKINYQK